MHNTGEPQNWGALKLRSLGTGGVADPYRYTYMCYVKFGSSATKRVRINTKETTKLGIVGTPPSFGWGVTDPLSTFPHVLPPKIL